MIREGLTLFSSDSRPKYAADILNVLSLPEGSLYNFRYESQYLSQRIKDEIENKDISGTRCITVFRDEESSGMANFMVPVRWVTLLEAIRISNFYILKLRMDEYPNVSDIYNRDKAYVCKKCTEYVREKDESKRQLPVQIGLFPYVDIVADSREGSWVDIARLLTWHDGFSANHFVRIYAPQLSNQKEIKVNEEGEYIIREGQYAYVRISHVSNDFITRDSKLVIKSDPDLIRVSNEDIIEFDSRYDSREILLHTGNVTAKTRAHIVMTNKSQSERYVNASVAMKFVIKPDYRNIAFKVVASCIGAGLVAVPGVAGDNIGFWVSVVIVTLGALILAMGANLRIDFGP